MSWGYSSAEYARALDEFGQPLHLSESDGWLLRRRIAHQDGSDAMGCYPIFACRDWRVLKNDLESIDGQLLSVVLVTDPFGDHTEENLREAFPDLMRPFKQHYIVDLRSEYEKTVDQHHMRNARKALAKVKVEQVKSPEQVMADWNQLYDNLIERHAIKGFARFSHQSFARQLQVPGMVVFRAHSGDEVVGLTLWFSDERIAYYHLGAYSDRGYELRASFAVFQTALAHFANRGLHHVDLGAGAGLTGDATDGLARFKRGWANASRTVHLCGRVLNRGRYEEFVARGTRDTTYFPAYRAGEFV